LRVWDTRSGGGVRAWVARRDACVRARPDRAGTTAAADPARLAKQRGGVGRCGGAVGRFALGWVADGTTFGRRGGPRRLRLCCCRQCLGSTDVARRMDRGDNRGRPGGGRIVTPRGPTTSRAPRSR